MDLGFEVATDGNCVTMQQVVRVHWLPGNLPAPGSLPLSEKNVSH